MKFLPSNFEELVKLLTISGGIIAFIWAVYQWKENQNMLNNQRQFEITKLADQRRIEAQAPFLSKQLSLYTEITQISARLATQSQSIEWQKSADRFWELYWGELALIENREVEAEMKQLGDALREPNVRAGEKLQQRSLSLAHAIRKSLDQSWSINIWTQNRN